MLEENKKRMNPTGILGKYLIKQLLISFLGVLALVLGLVFMFEVIDLLRRVSSRPDVGFDFVWKMALTKLPQTIEMVFPFVIMLSAMISFWKLSKSNEFVIIRASGVSIWGFLTPVLGATFIIGMINVAIINPMSSYLYEVHETLDYRFKTRIPDAVLYTAKGLWIRESLDNNNSVIFQSKSIRQEKDGLSMWDVNILELDNESQITRRIAAFMGILKEENINLQNVRIFKNGEPVEFLNSMDYKTSLVEDRIKESFVEPETISFWKLPDTIEFYEQSGFSAQKHRMRYLSLLTSPFLLCSMVLIAAVFALRPNNRRGGVIFLIVGGIATGFMVYFMSQVVYAFGINNYIPALLAAWSPALIITLISVSILLHLEDG